MHDLFGIITAGFPRRVRTDGSAKPYVPGETWRKFHLAGLQHGIRVVFFHPEDVDLFRNRVWAWVCESNDAANGWKLKWFRIPDVIYENVVMHALERTGTLIVKRKLIRRGIPVFNPRLFNKIRIFEILQRDKRLIPFIPKTMTVHRVKDVIQFLFLSKCVYLKPIDGSGGKGVIELMQEGVSVRVRSERFHNDKRFERLMTVTQLNRFLNNLLRRKKYIAQQGLNLISKQGRKIDFRVVVHRNETGKWHLIGIRPKLGRLGSIVTNTHSGGLRGDYHEIVKWAALTGIPLPSRELFEKIAVYNAELFTRYRPTLSHLGIDIGVDTGGNAYVLDVNNRPGRDLLTPSMLNKAVDSMTGFAKHLHRRKVISRGIRLQRIRNVS